MNERMLLSRDIVQWLIKMQKDNQRSIDNHLKRCSDAQTCATLALFYEVDNSYASTIKSEQEELNKLRRGINA